MSGRESAAMERALADVAANPADRLTYVAKRHGLDITSLRRALRKRGVAPRPSIPPRGPRGRTVLPMPEPYHFGD